MVGKHPPSKAEPAANTLLSPSPPDYGSLSSATAAASRATDAPDASEPASEVEGKESAARSSERQIAAPDASAATGCLTRREVRAYLRKSCPRAVRERVDGHTAGCVACMQWVRHLDDHILEYMGGQRPEAELARMDAHLDACDVCRGLMHHVVQGMAQSWDGSARDDAGSGTTFTAGQIVNSRYRIQRFVGRGGMGEVYEAFDQLMDRRVALKTVLCTVSDRPRASRRFKEEVRNAQRVGHAHVCRINELQEHHDGGFGPALPFFTMEFIEGERLGRRLTAGPLPLEEARTIALQLLAGLEAAHERGVLHLDFKSDNVMLRQSSAAPDAVIMDFGLSRVLDSETRLRTSERRQFAGTLAYMSVEQLECRGDVGPATDVYAFGVVLYEMLTRCLPFDGETLGAALLKQLQQRPRAPSQLRPELSAALDRFVLKCLNSDPLQRYADASQALAALKALGSWSRPKRRTRAWKLAVPVLLGGLLALLVQRSLQRSQPAATTGALRPEPAPGTPTAKSEPQLPPPAAGAAAASAAETAAASPEAAPAGATPAALPANAPPARTAPPPPRAKKERSNVAAPPVVREAAPTEPPPAPPSAATEAPAEEPGWKPAHVPKRLSAPSP